MTKKKFTRNPHKKKQLIYETFFNLITEQGYHNVSTNHVAEEAGIGIGTVYRHFPQGKKDILKDYFKSTIEEMFEKESLITLNNDNIESVLRHFIKELVKNHKKNQGFNIAFRAAIQSNKTLQRDHNRRVYEFFKDRAQKLRNINQNFKKLPEKEVLKAFIFMYNLINSILYHHLSVWNLFDTDEELINYLTHIVIESLRYLFLPD